MLVMKDKYATRRLEHCHFWKGGRAMSTEGYMMIHKRGHPDANKQGYIYEHRWIMEQYLGRKLESWELVHHRNEVRTDNRIENLELLTRAQHNQLHLKKDFSDRQCKICESKTTYFYRGMPWWYRHPITKEEWICRKCRERIIKYERL